MWLHKAFDRVAHAADMSPWEALCLGVLLGIQIGAVLMAVIEGVMIALGSLA